MPARRDSGDAFLLRAHLRRGLAEILGGEDRPEAFTPDLAMSLNNLAAMLSDLGRREDALQRAEEAVRTLAPFFISQSAAFAPWMATLVSVYSKARDAAQHEPDLDLLGPIIERLQATSRG